MINNFEKKKSVEDEPFTLFLGEKYARIIYQL